MITTTPSSISLVKRLLVSFAVSWVAAVSLGIIYGARVVGTFSIADLWAMAVIPVATIISSVIAVVMTPLVAWGLRNFGIIKWVALLWFINVVWILGVYAVTHSDRLALEGAIFLSVAGLAQFTTKFQAAASATLEAQGVRTTGQFDLVQEATHVIDGKPIQHRLDLPRRYYALGDVHGVADIGYVAESGRVTVIVSLIEGR